MEKLINLQELEQSSSTLNGQRRVKLSYVQMEELMAALLAFNRACIVAAQAEADLKRVKTLLNCEFSQGTRVKFDWEKGEVVWDT